MQDFLGFFNRNWSTLAEDKIGQEGVNYRSVVPFWSEHKAKGRGENNQLWPIEVRTRNVLKVEQGHNHTGCHLVHLIRRVIWIKKTWHWLPSRTISERKPVRNSKNNTKSDEQRKITWHLRMLVKIRSEKILK